jgi:hypothetical protein
VTPSVAAGSPSPGGRKSYSIRPGAASLDSTSGPHGPSPVNRTALRGMMPPMRSSLQLAIVGLSFFVTSSAAHTPRPADAIVDDVRRATVRYLDIARARADGFVQVSGMEARHGYHFMNVNASVLTAPEVVVGTLDLARPPMLLYVERDGLWQLAGVEYALPSPPVADPFPGAAWHRHESSCHYRDYREIAAPRAGDCPPRHPDSGEPYVLWHPGFAVAHVWAWIGNPDGPFAEENPALAAYGGTVHATPAHRHPRSATELAYSQVTHRVAGGILLLLAALIAWESRRPRPFPWSALSSPVWILFGLYLIPTSDPESWPWGPKRFVEIFTDPLVLQHKMLALVPITIGVASGLRSAGLLLRTRWTSLTAALAILSGFQLFAHFHDGHVHMDTIYLQHVAMGTTVVVLGIVLLIGRRAAGSTPRGEALLRWGWPGFLAVLALILFFYVEA